MVRLPRKLLLCIGILLVLSSGGYAVFNITISSPINGTTYAFNKIPLTWNQSETPSSCSATLDGVSYTYDALGTSGTGDYLFFVSNGSHTVNVTCIASDSNISSSSSTFDMDYLTNAIPISNCWELQNITWGNMSGVYKLTNDINCTNTSNWARSDNNGSGINGGFEPIGTYCSGGSMVATGFDGIFDGQGYEIGGVYIDYQTSAICAGGIYPRGLFFSAGYGAADYTHLLNFEMIEVRNEGYTSVGGIVGSSSDYIKLEKVSVTGVVGRPGNGGPDVGTIIGDSGGSLFIEQSWSNATIHGDGDTGGLIGNFAEIISDSYYNGDIQLYGGGDFGGLSGRGANILRSYAAGTMTGDLEGFGGLGGLVGDGSGTINDSFADMSLNPTNPSSDINGLVGQDTGYTYSNSYWNNRTDSLAVNCSNVGNPTGCNSIFNSTSYFYDSSSAPMSSWNFSGVWREYSRILPRLEWENYTDYTIYVDSPIEGQIYASSQVGLTWEANFTYSGCGYELDKNGTNVTLTSNINLTSLADGSHNVTVFCNETNGVLHQSDLVGWTVDTASPVVTILAPSNNTVYYSSSVDLNYSTSEATNWCGYELDQNGTNVTLSGNTTLTSLLDGNHNVSIYCNDTAGNDGYSGLILFSTDDVINITIIQPESNQNYSYLDLKWTTDKSPAWCGYSVDNEANITITTNITRFDLSYDTHNLTLYCNNTGGAVSLANVSFNVVAAAPTFNHTVSNQIVKYTENLSYDINCTDPNNDTLIYSVSSGHENVTINNESGLLFHSPSYNDLGNYQLNISCTDGTATATANIIYSVIDQIGFQDDPDDGSTEAQPTEVNTNVTFISSVVTDNGSNYIMYICKANDFNNETCGAGGTWCQSVSTPSGDNASCLVDTTGLTESSYTWYAFAKMNPWVEFGVPGDFHVNHKPTSATVNISPSTMYVNNTVICNVTALVDSDNDAEGTHDYEWYKDDVIQNLNSDTVNFTFSTGNTLICSARVKDEHGLQADDYINSTGKQVENSGVTAPTNLTNLSNNLIDHTPIINWTKGTDEDNDTVTTYIYMDSGACSVVDPTTLISSTNNSGYELGVEITVLVDGTTYCVRMRSHDGTAFSGYSDEEEFHMNSIPIMTSVDINPDPAYKNSVLSCVTITSDGESDSVSLLYWWTKNDTEVNGENSQTFDCLSNGCSSGDNLTCIANPYDGYEYGANLTSDVTLLVTTAPFWNEDIPDATIHHNENLSYQTDVTDDDTLSYWTNNSIITINTSGYIFDNPTATDEGVYDITITVGDGTTNITGNFTYTIINDIPTIDSWSFFPSPNSGANNATFNYTSSDNESDTIILNTTWYVNSTYISGTDDTTTLSQTNFGDGSFVTISVLLSDPYEDGTWVNYSQTMGDDVGPVIASVYIGNLDGDQITTADLNDTVSFFANATDVLSDVSWVKFQIKAPSLNSTNYTVYNIYSSNQYRFNKQVDELGTWYLEKVFSQDTNGNVALYTANLELEVSEGAAAGTGGGVGLLREKILVYNATDQQLLDITCGNRVCDKNEGPWNCAQDCPVNFDEIISGKLFGQYWFIQVLIFFITGTIIWTLVRGKSKKKKGKNK